LPKGRPTPITAKVLERIANEELQHYSIWKQYTGRDIAPDLLRIWFYTFIARLLGLTFAVKLMEGVEQGAQVNRPGQYAGDSRDAGDA